MFFTAPSARVLATAGLLILLGSNLLIRTKPTHSRHVARLFPGPTPLDLLPEPPPSEFLRRNHPPTSNTSFQDWRLFSLTRSKKTGNLSTVGVLGTVIDVRSEAERLDDQRAFDQARTEAVLRPIIPIMPGAAALRGESFGDMSRFVDKAPPARAIAAKKSPPSDKK